VCPEDYVVKFAQDEQKKISMIPAVFVHKPLLNRVLDENISVRKSDFCALLLLVIPGRNLRLILG
jgi:hypothetical protein